MNSATNGTAVARSPLPVSAWAKLKQASVSLTRVPGIKAAAVVIIFVWFPLLSMHNAVADPDIWWHMRTGEWIIAHHQLPRTDPFSVLGAGKPWVAYSWSFELLTFAVAKYRDLVGLTLLMTFTWLLATWAFYRLMRKLVPRFWLALAMTLLGSVAMTRAMGPRPGIFTILFFLLEMDILFDADRAGRVKKLWLLPLLFCAWANVHVQFVYGLFLLGVFCTEPLLNRVLRYKPAAFGEGRIPNKTLWLVLLLCTAATFVNPYGWAVYQVLIDYVRQPMLARYVGETNAMPFTGPGDYLALLLVIGAAFALGREQRVRPVWALLLVWAAVSAFRAQRDIWLLTIVCCACIGPRLSSGTGEMVPLDRRSRLLAIAGILAIIVLGRQFFGPTNRQLLSETALRLPLGSVAYIHEHHLQGPLFNHYDWGGFLIYALPEIPVSVDGRTNVHGQEELWRSFSTWSSMPGWMTDPLLDKANLVIAARNLPLTQSLRLDPNFKPVFEDAVAVVFQRVDHRN